MWWLCPQPPHLVFPPNWNGLAKAETLSVFCIVYIRVDQILLGRNVWRKHIMTDRTEGPRFLWNDDRTSVRIEFPTEPPTWVALDASELDQFIDQLANLRAGITPGVPIERPIGETFTAIENPTWYTEVHPLGEHSQVGLRHPGHGWQFLCFSLARSCQSRKDSCKSSGGQKRPTIRSCELDPPDPTEISSPIARSFLCRHYQPSNKEARQIGGLCCFYSLYKCPNSIC